MTIGKLNPFNPSSDDFEAWVGVLESFLLANDVDKSKNEAKAIAILLSSIGLPTYTLLSDLVSPVKPESKKLDELVKVLQDHYKPAPKAIAERYKFHCSKQKYGENVNSFLSELRRLAVTCKFSDLSTALRDQFIFGIQSEAAQKRLFLEDDNLKLDKAVQIAISQEQAESSTQIVRGSGSLISNPNQSNEQTNKVFNNNFNKNKKNKQKTDQPKSSQSCPNCGRGHQKKDCPHKNVECHKCQKKGHFMKFCRSPDSSSGQPKQQQQSSSSKNRKVYTVNQISKRDEPIILDVIINDLVHSMELDTASVTSFVPVSFWKQMGSPKLQKSNVVFRTYTGEEFEALGKLSCVVKYFGQSHHCHLHVSEGSSLFGRDL
jgi:hypothetical protein